MRFAFFAFLYDIGFLSESIMQREEMRMIKKMGRSWRLSGFTSDLADAGVIDIGYMSKRKALAACRDLNPGSTIIHVDDANHIITFKNNR